MNVTVFLMGQTFNHTMEKAPINATGQWQNPDTGHGGSVTPTRTFATEYRYALS